MRIIAISDTHSYHRQISIPDGDILVHCGDFSWRGELDILQDLCNFVKDLPHKKIFIEGNHETGHQFGYKREPALKMMRDAGIIYLQDSGVEIDGVYFYGSPFTPDFFGWEYMLQRGKPLANKWALIPERTNVIVSHGMPYQLLDDVPRGNGDINHPGCVDLRNRIDELSKLGNLKLVCGGHLHRDNNEQPIEYKGVKIANASICNNAYKPTNKPIIIDIENEKEE
jgi:predicted phosphodiesterase